MSLHLMSTTVRFPGKLQRRGLANVYANLYATAFLVCCTLLYSDFDRLISTPSSLMTGPGARGTAFSTTAGGAEAVKVVVGGGEALEKEKPPPPHALYSFFPHLTFQEKAASGGAVQSSKAVLHAGEVVVLYFSAHWCPPCRQFTPMLKALSDALPIGTVRFVFVSRDKTRGEFEEYFASMGQDWLAVDYGQSGLRDQMCIKYGIPTSGIPAVHLISNLDASSARSGELRADFVAFAQQLGDYNRMNVGVSLRKWLYTTAVPASAASTMRLPLNSYVRIVFVAGRKELNGRVAKVVGYRGMERIVVEPVKDGALAGADDAEESARSGAAEHIALRRKNLFPLTSSSVVAGSRISTSCKGASNGAGNGYANASGVDDGASGGPGAAAGAPFLAVETENAEKDAEGGGKASAGEMTVKPLLEPVAEDRKEYLVGASPGGAGGRTTLEATEVRFQPGTFVVVQGLEARPEKNGLFGIIAEKFDEAKGRYAVKLNDKETLMLKPGKFYV